MRANDAQGDGWYLASNTDLGILIISIRTSLLVGVVKNNSHAGFRNSSLSSFVYQVLYTHHHPKLALPLTLLPWCHASSDLLYSTWPRMCPYLQVLCSHSLHIRYPQDKTYRIEDIGFSGTIEAGDGVE